MGIGGPAAIAGTLDFQACNDKQCYAPASIAFRAEPPASASAAPRLRAAPCPLSQAPRGEAAIGCRREGRRARPLDFEQQLNRRGLPVVLAASVRRRPGPESDSLRLSGDPPHALLLGGSGAGEKRGVFRLALVYVLGMATTYSALGVAAALSGRLFGSALQSPWVLGGVAIILVAARSLHVRHVRHPDAELPHAESRSAFREGGAYAMGLLVGVVAAPCVGPFVLGLLAFVAARQQAALGFLFFFVLSLGLGLPYLFLGAFSGSLARLPRAGMWMEAVKKIFGWVLLAMAAYFLRPALPGRIGDWVCAEFSPSPRSC